MKNFRKLFVFAICCITLLCVSVSALAATGVYNTAAVNLRASASTSANSYGLVSKGATCDILSQGTTWCKVTITSHTKNNPDLYGVTGWSLTKYIDIDGSSSGGSSGGSSSVPSGPSKTGYIDLVNDSSSLNVRKAPNTSAGIVGRLYDGDIVTYIDTLVSSTGSDSNKWYYITSPKIGYVASQYVKAGTPVDNKKCSVCNTAKKTKHINPTMGGFHGLLQVGNNYYHCYNATATLVYYCLTHGEEYNAGIEDGYILEEHPGNFSTTDFCNH